MNREFHGWLLGKYFRKFQESRPNRPVVHIIGPFRCCSLNLAMIDIFHGRNTTAPWSLRNRDNLINKISSTSCQSTTQKFNFSFYLLGTTWSLQNLMHFGHSRNEEYRDKKCTKRIKLIWNLEIYDFHNPFDRTAYKTFYSDGDDDSDAVSLSIRHTFKFNLPFSFSPLRFHSFSFCFHLVD